MTGARLLACLCLLPGVLSGVLPVYGQERQRIASARPLDLETGARLDWRLVPFAEDEEGGGATLDAAGVLDIGFGGRWYFMLRLPATIAFSGDTGAVRTAGGDLSLGAALTGRRATGRWRADAHWTAPTGESSPWKIRDGALPSGGGAQRFGAELTLSLINDPVVLSSSLGAETALPQRVPSGRVWRAGELRASFALHEALNDEASWSIAATPAVTLPSRVNGKWTARGPAWSVSVDVQAGWYPGPFAFRSGTQSTAGGGWAWTGSAGARKEWKR